MDNRVFKTNTACALYETRACAILNAQSCENCPAAQTEGTKASKTVANYLDLFESLLPEDGVARLFESSECTLCKTEPKGKRSTFAIIDFGHNEPEDLQMRKLFQKNRVGFMLPLQFACCGKCRRRILLLEYLPALGVIIGLIPLIPFFVNPHWMQNLRAVASWFPLVLAVAAIGIGYLAGKLLVKSLKKRFSGLMYWNLMEHPVTQELIAKGWFPLFEEKRTVTPVFTKKRIVYGLGNARSSAYLRKNPENREKAD